MKKNEKKTGNKSKKTKIDILLEKNNQGIKLDLGCGSNKQNGFVGMDVRQLEGVDIVHNLEQFPYPLPNESVSLVVASHLLEHINPSSPDPKLIGLIKLLKKKKILTDVEIREYIGEYEFFGTFIKMMNELWRILKKDGEFAFVVPYAGSIGYWQDPSHVNPINESTLAYFDPLDRSHLYYIYQPAPWKIKSSSYQMNGNLEVVFKKRQDDISYHFDKKIKYV